MITVGSARSASLDDAGEVSEQPFYIHKLGWLVIHPKKKTHRHSLCLATRNAMSNDLLRYSQNLRHEIYKRGTDAKVVTHCDCSSLVTQLIRETMTNNMLNSTTETLKQNCLNTGLFTCYEYDGNTQLWNGDILVTKKKGHVVIVTHGGKKNTETSK